MAKERTELQRAAMDALQGARAAGMGLSAYARAHGLNARRLHDSIVGLRKRGLIPPADKPRLSKGAFVAVRMVSPTARLSPSTPPPPRTDMVCRVIHASGLVIECGEWPPAAWLLSLSSGRRDAAP
jgi:hypothetical protein